MVWGAINKELQQKKETESMKSYIRNLEDNLAFVYDKEYIMKNRKKYFGDNVEEYVSFGELRKIKDKYYKKWMKSYGEVEKIKERLDTSQTAYLSVSEELSKVKKERRGLRQEIVMNNAWTDKQSFRMDGKDAEIYKLKALLKKKLSNSIFEKLDEGL